MARTYAKNIGGTTKHTSQSVCGCGSWSEHLIMNTRTRRNTCSAVTADGVGCDNDFEVGAHVKIVGGPHDGATGVVALCRSHNHHAMSETFELKRDVWLAEFRILPNCPKYNGTVR